jgi:hypothetical protein
LIDEEKLKIKREKKYNETHKILNGVDYKKCSKHKKYFPNEDEWIECNDTNYYKNKANGIDGYHPCCKKCGVKVAAENQYERYHNGDELKKYHREYFLDNQDYYRDVTRKYQKKKKDIIKKNQKIWWRTHKDQISNYNKNRQHKNHTITKEEWNYCLDYFNHECAYCGLPEDKHFITYRGKTKVSSLHKEHVIHNGANDLSNCVPACRDCNSSKNSRMLEEWYNENISVFDEDRLKKIKKWLRSDYKSYIKQMKYLPYNIKRVRNEDGRYHFELWSKDDNDNMVKCIAKADKKKDLNTYIDKYYNGYMEDKVI